MQIFPAIDLKDGHVVRLTQGDYNQVDVYNDDPTAVARDFYEKGARCLHVVDLDGAKEGTLANFASIRAIVEAAPLFVEVGGGIRDEERIKTMLDLGVGRVILGTAAVRNFPFLAEMAAKYGEKIVLGVDARDGFVSVDGWTTTTGEESFAFCERARDAGVKTVIYTDIATDGAMRGTNLPAFHRLCEIEGLDVVASGGVCTLAELRELRRMGCAGAIVGKALYTGALSLEEVLAL